MEKTPVVKQEDSLLKIFNKAPVGIITFSNEGLVEYINESLFKIGNLYRIDFSNLSGSNIFRDQIIPDTDLNEEFNSLKDGIPFEIEIKNLHTINKDSISLILKGSSFFEEGNFAGGILILEDIEVLSEVKKEKEERTNLIEKLFSKTSNYALVTDIQGKIKYAFGKDLSKLGEEDSLPRDYSMGKLFPASQQKKINSAIEVVTKTKSSTEINLEKTVDNQILYFICRVEPSLNKRKQVQFLFFILEDITSSIKENANLKKERDELLKLQSISEALTDALFVVDLDGKVLFWNKAAEGLFGYSRSEVHGKFFGRILGLFDTDLFNEIKKELNNSGLWIKEITVFKKNREKEIVEAKFTYTSSDKNEIIILCSNITIRAASEQRLKLSEEKYKNFIFQTEEILCTLEIDGSISFVNPAFIKTFNYSENELLKKNITDLIESNKNDAVGLNLQSIEKITNKKYEFSLKSKYGNSILVSARFVPVVNEAGKIKSIQLLPY